MTKYQVAILSILGCVSVISLTLIGLGFTTAHPLVMVGVFLTQAVGSCVGCAITISEWDEEQKNR